MTASAPVIVHQEIVKGDDYKAAEGRALVWASPQWPNLAGASLAMVVGSSQPSVFAGFWPITFTGAVPAGVPIWTATIEMSHIQTGAIALPGCYDYTLTATLPDGDVETLATGQLSVLAAPTSYQP